MLPYSGASVLGELDHRVRWLGHNLYGYNRTVSCWMSQGRAGWVAGFGGARGPNDGTAAPSGPPCAVTPS